MKSAKALPLLSFVVRDKECSPFQILVALDASSACWERYPIRADEASALLTTSGLTDSFNRIAC